MFQLARFYGNKIKDALEQTAKILFNRQFGGKKSDSKK